MQTALQELDTEKLGKAGGTMTGNLEIGSTGSLTFEGPTPDLFETTLAVADPTADRTLTFPDVDGTIVTTTYGHWTEGEAPYVASVHFTMQEIDTKAKER